MPVFIKLKPSEKIIFLDENELSSPAQSVSQKQYNKEQIKKELINVFTFPGFNLKGINLEMKISQSTLETVNEIIELSLRIDGVSTKTVQADQALISKIANRLQQKFSTFYLSFFQVLPPKFEGEEVYFDATPEQLHTHHSIFCQNNVKAHAQDEKVDIEETKYLSLNPSSGKSSFN